MSTWAQPITSRPAVRASGTVWRWMGVGHARPIRPAPSRLVIANGGSASAPDARASTYLDGRARRNGRSSAAERATRWCGVPPMPRPGTLGAVYDLGRWASSAD